MLLENLRKMPATIVAAVAAHVFSPVVHAEEAQAKTLDSTSFYQRLFDREMEQHRKSLDELALTGNCFNGYYCLQWPLRAVIHMYQATGEERYIRLAIEWSITAVAQARLRDEDGYLHWEGPWDEWGAEGIAYFLWAIQASTEIARTASIVRNDPHLNGRYGSKARILHDHIKKNILERYWEYINDRKDRACNNHNEAMSDKAMLAAQTLAHIHMYSADTRLENMARQIVECFQQRVSEFDHESLIWDIQNIDSPYTDTDHANRVPGMVLALYESGFAFDRDMVTGIARLYSRVIWNGSVSDPLFYNFIDGTNKAPHNKPLADDFRAGAVWYGFAWLSTHDCEAAAATQALLEAIEAGNFNPSVIRNGTVMRGLGKLNLIASLARAAAWNCHC